MIYTTSIFFLCPEQIIFHIMTLSDCISKLCSFFILVLIVKQFFLKILKHSKFTRLVIVIIFLFTVSTITDHLLKITKILKKNFFFIITIKILVLKDLWIDKYFDSEIKNNFFLDSILYRIIKTLITAIFFLDLLFKICLFYPNLENFHYFLSLRQLIIFTDLYISPNNQIFFNKIVNSTYSILILCTVNCVIIFLYYIAFYKKKSDHNNVKNLYEIRKYNFLSKNNKFIAPLGRFLFLEKKNETLLSFDKIPDNKNNWKTLEEKKRWIVRKNAINIPFGIILYANEFQVTKQRIWYEIKNGKS